jgi:Fe-S-cluster containining protein
MAAILDSLPLLYRDLLPSFFRAEAPTETKATCANCAMSRAAVPTAVDSVDGVNHLFRADTKCCTYHPRLPNYLVGALLSDDSPAMAEGRRRVEQRIDSRIGVNPQWLKPPAKFNHLYKNAHQFFGRASSLRCPYYALDTGGCTIWAYRESVCSTFFCKYVAGADGRRFWMSLKTYLTLTEFQLSRHALLQLMPEFLLDGRDKAEVTPGPLSVEDLDDVAPPQKAYAALWKGYTGMEHDFYRACYDAVRAVSKDDLDRMLGLDGTIELKVLQKLHGQATAPVLPRVLRFNPDATVKWLPDGSVALGAYSEFDAVALPGEAYSLLVEFTGQKPVEAVRQHLRDHRRADLDPDILLELHRHRILIEP